MSTGISSIADLQIVVDAKTETFTKGITDARATLASFTGDSGTMLTAFDGSIGKIGTLATGLQGKLGLLSTALSAGLGAAAPALALISTLAEKIGASEELNEAAAATTELGDALKDAAGVGFEALISRVKEMKNNLLGLAETNETVATGQQELTQKMLRGWTEMVRDATTNVKYLAKGVGDLTIVETERQIKSLEASLGDTIRKFGEMRNAAATSRMDGSWSIMQSGYDPIAEAAAVEAITKALTALREELTSKINANWTADLVFADMGKYIEQLQRQTQEMRLQNETFGMSKARAAEHLAIRRAELEAEAQAKKAGVDEPYAISGEDRQKITEGAAAIRRMTQARDDHADALKREADFKRMVEQQEKGVVRLDDTVAADKEKLDQKLRALQMGTEKTEGLAYAENLLAKARRDNILLTDEEVAGIYSAGEAYAELNRAVRALEEQKRQLQQVSSTVSNSIMSEFSSWTRGAEFNVKRMTANILAELAKIVLQKNVLEGVFGGGTGGTGGGMFGNLLGSLFGGARASGGPVAADRAYLVGERGPELFLPQSAGHVVSNGDLAALSAPRGSSTTVAPTINLSFDVRGADANVIEELRRLKAELPSRIVSVMADARERSLA